MSGESRRRAVGIDRLRVRTEAHLYAGQCITEVAEKFVTMMEPFDESHRGTVMQARQILLDLALSEMRVAQGLADVATHELEQVGA